MKTYNKLLLASEMFLDAHKKYLSANSDIEYIESILLSGAVLGVVSPLVKEQGKRTTHQILADIGKALDPVSNAHEGLYRHVYNALKHTGNQRQAIDPSQDLEVRTDFRIEAARMLEAARDDFNRVSYPANINLFDFSDEFHSVVGSSEPYA